MSSTTTLNTTTATEPTAIPRKGVAEKTSDIHDAELYALTRRVADTVFEYANTRADLETERPWLQDWRHISPNPYFNQTNGLFLEVCGGIPLILWTPWGAWTFGGSGHSAWKNKGEDGKSLLDKVLERLGATLFFAEGTTPMGGNTAGPVYSLHEVDGIALPIPEELETSAFGDHEAVADAWKALSA